MNKEAPQGKLSVVATPIGNMEDITLRALGVLKVADLILCEDTRVTRKLCERHDIAIPLVSFHAHSGEAKIERALTLLSEGGHVALVSDAGTPAISDPGALLVARVREALPSVVIEALPGASALTTALSIAGIAGSDFTFLGFLPHKKGRETLFREIAESARTIVFYESPHRILKTLASLIKHAPEKHIIIARELTKMHEEVLKGNAEELLGILEEQPVKQKGEFVVIVECC